MRALLALGVLALAGCSSAPEAAPPDTFRGVADLVLVRETLVADPPSTGRLAPHCGHVAVEEGAPPRVTGTVMGLDRAPRLLVVRDVETRTVAATGHGAFLLEEAYDGGLVPLRSPIDARRLLELEPGRLALLVDDEPLPIGETRAFAFSYVAYDGRVASNVTEAVNVTYLGPAEFELRRFTAMCE